MAYTDKELLDSTQIAGIDLNEEFKQLQIGKAIPPILLKDLIIKKGCNLEEMDSDLSALEVGTEKYEQQRAKCEIYHKILDESGPYSNWKVAKIIDDSGDPGQSGFYGCVFETGSHDAIVAMRGSETLGDPTHVLQDWFENDVDLLYGKETPQQKKAEELMAWAEDHSDYTNVAVCGHSLGGNLAFHVAITASDNMKNRLTQVVSFDGPNMPEEYVEKYRDEIAAISDRMTHYKWSLVGNTFATVPGVKEVTVKVKDYADAIQKSLVRHDPAAVTFDSDGNLVEGEQDGFSKIWLEFTIKCDKDPYFKYMVHASIKLTGYLYEYIEWVFGEKTVRWIFGALKDKEKIARFIPLILLSVFILLGGLVIFTIEVIVALIDKVCAIIVDIVDWSKEKIQKLIDAVNRMKSQILEWYNRSFNQGYQYSLANPYIAVDTYCLEIYGARLSSANQRLLNLDQRLDDLYFRIGIENILSLGIADISTGYSFKLSKCIGYLIDTAAAFETVEKKLAAQII